EVHNREIRGKEAESASLPASAYSAYFAVLSIFYSRPLAKQIQDRFSQAIAGYVEGAFLDFVAQPGRDSQRAVNRGMQILDDDAFVEGFARPLIGRAAMQIASFDASAEQQHAARVGEMPVHAIMFHLIDDFRDGQL